MSKLTGNEIINAILASPESGEITPQSSSDGVLRSSSANGESGPAVTLGFPSDGDTRLKVLERKTLSNQPTGDQRARDAVMSSKPTPVYEQAECFPECDDAHCPYTHFGMWRVGDKTFYSLEEAERASIEAAS